MPASRARSFIPLVALVLAVATNEAHAQPMLGLEAGYRTDKHLNGVNEAGGLGGVSVTQVIGGRSTRNTALIFPISGEIRMSSQGYHDVNAFLDMSVRTRALTVGVGGAFSWG